MKYKEKQVYMLDLILQAIKNNVMLKSTPDDMFVARKSMEGTTSLAYLVMFALVEDYGVDFRLINEHFNLTDVRIEEYNKTLSKKLNKNDNKLINKIKLCKRWVELNKK